MSDEKQDTINVAINGFGRIGPMFLRQAMGEINNGRIKVAAINDLFDGETLAYAMKHDSVHGAFPGKVEYNSGKLIVDGHSIDMFSVADPSKLPWADYGIDVVVESTGRFTNYEGENGGASSHLKAGAKYVVISAPGSDDLGRIQTIVIGINENDLDTNQYKVFSNASCTTNCLSHVVKVLEDYFELEVGYMDTIHAYTNGQSLLDSPHKKMIRGNAAALNIIPTSTGASKAISKVMPELEGRLDGYSLRVPVPDVSIISLFSLHGRDVIPQEINEAMKAEAEKKPGIFRYSSDLLVSTHLIGDTNSAVLDSNLTFAKGRISNVKAWYDNEAGYSRRLVELTQMIGGKGR